MVLSNRQLVHILSLQSTVLGFSIQAYILQCYVHDEPGFESQSTSALNQQISSAKT